MSLESPSHFLGLSMIKQNIAIRTHLYFQQDTERAISKGLFLDLKTSHLVCGLLLEIHFQKKHKNKSK